MWEPFFSFSEFKKKIASDLKRKYSSVVEEENKLIIATNTFEITVPLTDSYGEYEVCQNYEFIYHNLLIHLEECLADYHQELDYDRVFPCLRKYSEDDLFISEPFQLDLAIYYVQDLGDSYRFIERSDVNDFEKLKKHALKNLKNTSYKWSKIDPNHSLWSFEEVSDYSATLIILSEVRADLESKLGSEFYISFSSATSILAGACTILDYTLLKKLVEFDPDYNKISDEIYLYKSGHLSYVYPKDQLKIISGGAQDKLIEKENNNGANLKKKIISSKHRHISVVR